MRKPWPLLQEGEGLGPEFVIDLRDIFVIFRLAPLPLDTTLCPINLVVTQIGDVGRAITAIQHQQDMQLQLPRRLGERLLDLVVRERLDRFRSRTEAEPTAIEVAGKFKESLAPAILDELFRDAEHLLGVLGRYPGSLVTTALGNLVEQVQMKPLKGRLVDLLHERLLADEGLEVTETDLDVDDVRRDHLPSLDVRLQRREPSLELPADGPIIRDLLGLVTLEPILPDLAHRFQKAADDTRVEVALLETTHILDHLGHTRCVVGVPL